jgi:hypothetical protein
VLSEEGLEIVGGAQRERYDVLKSREMKTMGISEEELCGISIFENSELLLFIVVSENWF